MKFVRLAILIIIGLVVFGSTMTFAGKIPNATHLWLRLGLLVLFGGLWLAARGDGGFGRFRPVFFAYFAIVAGLTAGWYGMEPITTRLALGFTPMSNAVAKAVQAGLITATMLVLTLAGGQTLSSLHLRKGRLALGLGFGLAGFLVMIALTFLPGGPFMKPGALDAAKLLPVLPWVLLFATSNALMEELLFRGVLLERQAALVGPRLALISTALIFALSHVQVTYAAQLIFFVAFVFVLGLLWGYLMQKSKGIWGSLIFHAGADVAVILPIYQAMIH